MFRSYSEKICRTDLKSKKHPVAQSFTCDTCDQSNWLTETDVELHKREAHFPLIHDQMENHKERFCTICMKLQDSHSTLVSHIKSRHLLSSPNARRVEREIYICHHCNRIFFNKDMIRAHIMNYHTWKGKGRNTKTFACPKCKKICRLKSLWFHFQLHEIPSISGCDICLANFPDLKELEKHLKIHPFFYKCEICCYQTSKEAHFDAHLQHHTQTKFKEKDIGRLVNKVFRKHSPYTAHRYNIHHALKGLDLPTFIHVCILCREICTDKIEVRTHIIRDHQNSSQPRRRYACSCGREFFNRVLLRHHVFKEKMDHRELSDSEIPPEPTSPQPVVCEEPASPEQYVVIQEAEDTDAPGEQLTYVQEAEDTGSPGEQLTYVQEAEDTGSPGEQLTYVYAEIEDDQMMMAIDGETNEEVIGF